jgi:O-antigen ligase
MAITPIAKGIHLTRLTGIADCLVIAVAVSLPWSTSATVILLLLWLLLLIPTLEWHLLRRELLTAAGGLPVLLFLLGVLGMLWADVSWFERWKGLDSFFKLMTIPLLLVQFRRSERGWQVLAGYGLSCVALLLLSTEFYIFPRTAFLFTHDAAVRGKM